MASSEQKEFWWWDDAEYEVGLDGKAAAMTAEMPCQNVYVCDAQAYDLLNHPRTTELQTWVQRKKESGALFCIINYTRSVGWRGWEALCGMEAIKALAPFCLRALGFSETEVGDEQLLDSMMVYISTSCYTSVPSDDTYCMSNVVFVTGNERFYEALAQEGAWRKMSLLINSETGCCADHYKASYRVWPVVDGDTEPAEQCLRPDFVRRPTSEIDLDYGPQFLPVGNVMNQLRNLLNGHDGDIGDFGRLPSFEELDMVYEQAKLSLPIEMERLRKFKAHVPFRDTVRVTCPPAEFEWNLL